MKLTEQGRVLIDTTLKLKEISDNFPADEFCDHPCEECLFYTRVSGLFDKKCIIAMIDNFIEGVKE